MLDETGEPVPGAYGLTAMTFYSDGVLRLESTDTARADDPTAPTWARYRASGIQLIVSTNGEDQSSEYRFEHGSLVIHDLDSGIMMRLVRP